MNILDKLGFYGPIIMIAANVYELRNRLFHVFLFIVYIFINVGMNKQLKLWIKQPRPSNYNSNSLIEMENDWVEYSGAEKYGMPSGHSMLMFFSWMYLWWNTKNMAYMILGGFLTFLTLYQRWKYKKHTVAQLAIGGILGITFSYLAYIATKKWFAKMNYVSSDRVKSSLDNV